MSPESLIKDPGILAVLIGAVAKGKDFVVTKGLAVAVTLIFTTGGMYYEFNELNKKMEKTTSHIEALEKRINSMESKIISTNGRIDVVATKIENVKETISDWMRLYAPKRLVP